MSVSAENLAAAVMSAAAAASTDNKENNTSSRTVASSNSASSSSAKFSLVDPFSAAKVKMYDAEKKQMILMRAGQEALTGAYGRGIKQNCSRYGGKNPATGSKLN